MEPARFEPRSRTHRVGLGIFGQVILIDDLETIAQVQDRLSLQHKIPDILASLRTITEQHGTEQHGRAGHDAKKEQSPTSFAPHRLTSPLYSGARLEGPRRRQSWTPPPGEFP